MTSTRIFVNPLNLSSVSRAISDVHAYGVWIQDTLNELLEIIAKYGEDQAIRRVQHIDTGETINSIHGFTHFASVGKKEAIIMAGGAAVWIEFGTGVLRNPSDAHPYRPNGIVGIGEYGNYGRSRISQGAEPRGWYYPTDREELALTNSRGYPARMRSGMYLAFTYGMPQNMFMWNTAQAILKQIPTLAKEVF